MNKFQDTFSIEGHWWFPTNQERAVPGILYYSPTGIKLHLMGALTDMNTFNNQVEYEMILGMSTDGKPITLHKCYGTNFHSTNIRFSTTEYSILYVFVGRHFSTRDDIRFKKIHLHLIHFDEWMRRSGFQMNIPQNPAGTFGISYTPPEMIEFELNEQFSLSIFFGFSHHIEHVGEKEQGIKQRIVLTIESSEETSFFEFQKISSDICKFLSLACLNPVYPISVSSSYPVTENVPETEIFFQSFCIIYETRYDIIRKS